MRKIIEAAKKFFVGIKQWYMRLKKVQKIFLLLFSLLILFLVVETIFNYRQDLQAKSKTEYIVKDSDYLFNIDEAELKKVSKFIVVEANPISFRVNRDVFIKFSSKTDKNKVYVVKEISQEAYEIYQKTVLLPYVENNKNFTIRYVSNLKDINKRLDVEGDPIELIRDTELSGFMTGFMDFILKFALLFLILGYLIYVQRNSTTVAISSISPEDINDSMSDLIGLDDVKAEIIQLQHMFENKSLYKKFNIHTNFNVMMTGPAGVGKTKIARCLTKHLNVPMYYCSAASLQSGYVGGGSRALKKLVKSAGKHKRAIIFLDEAESLLQSRTHGAQHWEKETINTLLSLLDGVNQNSGDIIWLVASNMDEYKINMDEAMLRRFHLKVNFRLPNFEERKAIFEALLGKIDPDSLLPDIDLNHIAGISSGMSPAIIETIVGRAGLMAIQEKIQISQDVLIRAFERVAVGLTDRETTLNRDMERLLIARHEAGHFIVKLHTALMKCKGDLTQLSEHLDVIKISTEAVSKLGALGFVLSKEREVKLVNREDFEQEIMQLYGGMANEEIYYGQAGVTAGAQNDIEKVSQILKVMVGQVGFYQPHKLNYSVLNGGNDLTKAQLEIIESNSIRLYELTKEVLTSHKQLTDLLVNRLMSEYVLTIDQCIEMIVNYFQSEQNLLDSYINPMVVKS